MPRIHRDEPWLFVHGSARNPVNEYVFPEDIYNQKKMEKLFSLVPRLLPRPHARAGRVHREPQFHDARRDGLRLSTPTARSLWSTSARWASRATATIAPCYVIQEDEQLTFRRIDYDFDVTADKIYSIPDLDDFLGDRIKQGR